MHTSGASLDNLALLNYTCFVNLATLVYRIIQVSSVMAWMKVIGCLSHHQ